MTKKDRTNKHALETYFVEEAPDGWTVYDRLENQTFRVQRFRRKYVSHCSCGETGETIHHQCSHQAAVRRYLMDAWWFGKDSSRSKRR